MKTGHSDNGLSDWHNLTFTVLKGNCIPFKRTKKGIVEVLRSLSMMHSSRTSSGYLFTFPHVWRHKWYWAHDKILREVVDEHISIKQKCKRKHNAPFMISGLHRDVNHKKALRREFLNQKTDKNWQKKKDKQRNFVTQKTVNKAAFCRKVRWWDRVRGHQGLLANHPSFSDK